MPPPGEEPTLWSRPPSERRECSPSAPAPSASGAGGHAGGQPGVSGAGGAEAGHPPVHAMHLPELMLIQKNKQNLGRAFKKLGDASTQCSSTRPSQRGPHPRGNRDSGTQAERRERNRGSRGKRGAAPARRAAPE